MDRTRSPAPETAVQPHQYAVEKYGHRKQFWALYDPSGELVCVTLYKKGALEVARRLADSSCRCRLPATSP